MTGPYENELVLEHRWLAQYCANRFEHRGEPADDLTQVAQLGLLKASSAQSALRRWVAAFAVPTMLGELKRHFRDATWPLRVPRRASDLLSTLATATNTLCQALRRSPTTMELARHLQLADEEVRAGLEASHLYRTDSLALTDAADRRGTIGRTLSRVLRRIYARLGPALHSIPN